MLDRVTEFLANCGLTLHVQPGVTGFLSHVKIADGQLWIDPVDDKAIGSLLHEAGHLAVIPGMFRNSVSDNVDSDMHAHIEAYMIAHPNAFDYPEDKVARALMQCGEAEAIAWSYAAAHHIGLDTRLPFLNGFDGEGMEVHEMLLHGQHFGINGLAAAGMTRVKNCLRNADDVYPNMIRWVQP